MFVLNRKEMNYFDSTAINKMKIPSRILMENAGRGCADYINKKFSSTNNKVIIFCGSGNNGGDGFVIARWLKNYDYQVLTVLVDDIDKMREDTKANHDLVKNHNIPIFKIRSSSDWENLNMNLKNFDLIIDAIFGTGFKGTISDWRKSLISEINAIKTEVISVDIPSGVDCNTGIADSAIHANTTLTMANYKLGHFVGEGREKSGEVKIINIGIPLKLYDEYHPKTELVVSTNIKFPNRNYYYHKGDYGKIGIIAGSPGLSGAAFLASEAALNSGAGLITLLHPKGMELIFENKLTEVMKYALDEVEDGSYDIDKIMEKISTFDALLVGPGWGTSDRNATLLNEILLKWTKPLILDADAINLLAKNLSIIKQITNKDILITPHYGEFSRLIKKTINQLVKNPVNLPKEFAYKTGIKVLLKSNTSLFTDGRNIRLNISGNDGLATGGSGDVLAGIIVSFIGQKLPVIEAPTAAAYLLGKTAEKLSHKRGAASITPTRIIETLFEK